MNGCHVRVVTLTSVGLAPVQFDKDTCGRRLDGDYGNYQLVCKNMGGAGTFKVELLGPDDEWREYIAAANFSDTVLLGDVLHFQAVRVTFAGTGPGAVPVATLSLMGRTYRYSS